MVGGTPILNFEPTPPPLNKIFNGLLGEGTPIKISNWNDKTIKIAKKYSSKFCNKEKNDKKIILPPTVQPDPCPSLPRGDGL